MKSRLRQLKYKFPSFFIFITKASLIMTEFITQNETKVFMEFFWYSINHQELRTLNSQNTHVFYVGLCQGDKGRGRRKKNTFHLHPLSISHLHRFFSFLSKKRLKYEACQEKAFFNKRATMDILFSKLNCFQRRAVRITF